jgi:hypothetical protein
VNVSALAPLSPELGGEGPGVRREEIASSQYRELSTEYLVLGTRYWAGPLHPTQWY